MSGPSGCGKTRLVSEMIRRHDEIFEKPPSELFIICKHPHQGVYAEITRNSPCPVTIMTNGLTRDFKGRRGGLVIADDILADNSLELEQWFIR